MEHESETTNLKILLDKANERIRELEAALQAKNRDAGFHENSEVNLGAKINMSSSGQDRKLNDELPKVQLEVVGNVSDSAVLEDEVQEDRNHDHNKQSTAAKIIGCFRKFYLGIVPENEEDPIQREKRQALKEELHREGVVPAVQLERPDLDALEDENNCKRCRGLDKYFRKWKGITFRGTPRIARWPKILVSFLSSFAGIAILGLMDQYWLAPQFQAVGIVASFGAAAVLLFAAESPLAQPRQLIFGNAISALVGVAVFKIMRNTGLVWLEAALAVSLSIVAMQLTNTLHPPGGATALVFVIGSDFLHAQGFLFILVPIVVGSFIFLIVALISHNILSQFPLFWI